MRTEEDILARIKQLDAIVDGYEAIGGRPKGSEGVYAERDALL